MQLGLHGKMHRTASASTRDSAMQRLKAELNLTGSQTGEIARILDDYRGYYQSIQDQLDDVRATGKSQILKILNPEQRTKFEKMMTDLAPQLAAPSTPAK